MADIQLFDGTLILVWCKRGPTQGWEIHVWDAKKGELQTIDAINKTPRGLRISGDRSKVFCVDDWYIQAWCIQTGMHIGRVSLGSEYPYHLDPLWIDGSKVLVRCRGSSTLSWDFGIPGSTSVQTSTLLNRPNLDFIGTTSQQSTGQIGIEDRTTGNVVFHLPGKKPIATQWDGHYLIVGYETGEVLILDLSNMLS